jgi:TusA-related sulfurtransferase
VGEGLELLESHGLADGEMMLAALATVPGSVENVEEWPSEKNLERRIP